MWSRADVSTPSLIEEVDILRKEVCKRLYESWKKSCQKALKNNEVEPLPPNRIEFLPIQWYEIVHGKSSPVKQSVSSVTLKTIPLMRSLANDVVFDVMMYLTPEFCMETLEFVTKHINDDLKKIMDINPDFDPLSKEIGNDCRCSIIGHSLGSVIVWDILATLKIDMEKVKVKDTSGGSSYNPMELFNLPLTCLKMPTIPNVTKDKENDNATNANADDVPLWGPIVPSTLKHKLMFIPGKLN